MMRKSSCAAGRARCRRGNWLGIPPRIGRPVGWTGRRGEDGNFGVEFEVPCGACRRHLVQSNRVRDFVIRELVTVEQTTPIAEIARQMSNQRVGSAIVV